jgi:hypothetical protein
MNRFDYSETIHFFNECDIHPTGDSSVCILASDEVLYNAYLTYFHNRNETLLTKLEFIRQAKDLGFLHNKDIFIDDKTISAFELHPSCDKWNIRKIG